MKNIFLIPTENPSRLYKGDNGLLAFGLMKTSTQSINDYFTNQNIYITSDEKFVRDEYITDGIEVIKASPKLVNAQGLVDRRNWKKIIITNDLELIKYGVQSVDDEFLEWFVKNPSCEVVLVRDKPKVKAVVKGLGVKNFNNGYKIIIPKEEPKKVLTEEDIFNQKDIDAVTDYINKEQQKQHLIDMMKSDEELGLYDEKIEDIELEEVRGSIHCQFSVVENKLAIIYRNQLKILQAIKMLNNER